MSATRSRSYRPPRDRREVIVAVLGSLAVLAITGLLLWVLAPEQETSTPDITDITPPTTVPITPPSSTPTSTIPG
jgi:hypothetical protein